MLNEMQAKYVKKNKQCIDSYKQHEKKILVKMTTMLNVIMMWLTIHYSNNDYIDENFVYIVTSFLVKS